MKKTQKSFNSTLKKTKGINPKSEKRKMWEKKWQKVKMQRVFYLLGKYNCLICEYCGSVGTFENDSPFWLGAHHIDRDRKNNTKENCYLCHNKCHDIITLQHILVEQEDFQGCHSAEHGIKEVTNE